MKKVFLMAAVLLSAVVSTAGVRYRRSADEVDISGVASGSRIRIFEACYTLQERTLARSGMTDDGNDFVVVYGQGYVIQGDMSVIDFCNMADLNHLQEV